MNKCLFFQLAEPVNSCNITFLKEIVQQLILNNRFKQKLGLKNWCYFISSVGKLPCDLASRSGLLNYLHHWLLVL